MKNNIKELWQSKIINERRKLHLNDNKKIFPYVPIAMSGTK